MSLIAGALTALIFLLMLFNPRVRRGIDAANLELSADRPFPSFRRVRFRDPQWGLLGKRYGSPALAAIRTALYVELFPSMLLVGWLGQKSLWLAASGLAVAMILSIYHHGLSTAVGDGNGGS